MRASFGNCATVREPSIWPLMPTRNGSGQQAAQSLAHAVSGSKASTARLVSLPDGHDPNSFFVQGGDARQFQSLLEAAR